MEAPVGRDSRAGVWTAEDAQIRARFFSRKNFVEYRELKLQAMWRFAHWSSMGSLNDIHKKLIRFDPDDAFNGDPTIKLRYRDWEGTRAERKVWGPERNDGVIGDDDPIPEVIIKHKNVGENLHHACLVCNCGPHKVYTQNLAKEGATRAKEIAMEKTYPFWELRPLIHERDNLGQLEAPSASEDALDEEAHHHGIFKCFIFI